MRGHRRRPEASAPAAWPPPAGILLAVMLSSVFWIGPCNDHLDPVVML